MFVSSSKRKHWVCPRSSSPASELSIWVISWKVDAREACEACERRRESDTILWPLAASLARVFSHGLLRCFARTLFAAWDAGETFQAARSGKKRLYSQATWVFACCKTRFVSGKRKKRFSVLTLLVVGTSSARVTFVNRIELYRYAVPQPPWHMSLRQMSWKSQTTRR